MSDLVKAVMIWKFAPVMLVLAIGLAFGLTLFVLWIWDSIDRAIRRRRRNRRKRP